MVENSFFAENNNFLSLELYKPRSYLKQTTTTGKFSPKLDLASPYLI